MKFEELVKKLEKITQDLESDTCSLDTAIKKYQEGIEISKKCFAELERAEKKVQMCVRQKNGAVKLKPFVRET